MRVVLLAGGLGGARLAPALGRALGARRLTVIGNVGDDLWWMGLRVCPDLDSITYAAAGLWDAKRVWGRRGETFRACEALAAVGAPAWFHVGDADLALHLQRTRLLGCGRTLTEVTEQIARRLGVRAVSVVPASDEPAATRFVLRGGGEMAFQEWYVRRRARPALARTMLSRKAASAAALAALDVCDAVVLGPSNPVTSVGAVLALRGMTAAVRAVRRRIAVSPVVIGRRSDDRGVAHHTRARRAVLAAEGGRDRHAAIAARYRGLVDTFVLDRSDRDEADAIRRLGIEPVLADVLEAATLARTLRMLASR
jgi:LPPG:FO 2-phospho-L-lactate transferase